MSVFFTADTHFGHGNVIGFCDRPFTSVEHMDRAMVEIWNAAVRPRDEVWHLGDFGFGRKATDDRMRRIFDALHGTKNLVCGNHDGPATLNLPWASVQERKVLKHDGHVLVLDHYPMRTWYGAHHGSLNLYGHVHGRLAPTDRAVDVGGRRLVVRAR